MTLVSLFLAAAVQAAMPSPPPVTDAQVRSLNTPIEPIRRTPPLSTGEAESLPVRVLADRSFGQLSDTVVDASRPGGLATNIALQDASFMLQPTGAGIGGLCRSTQVTVHFGSDTGPHVARAA